MKRAKIKPIKVDLNLRDQVSAVHESAPIVEKTGHGELLCFESMSGRWFRSSETEVMRVTQNLNKILQNDVMAIQVNDVFQLLGIYVTGQYNDYEFRAADIPPWGELFDVDLKVEGYKYFKNEPVLVININVQPVKRYSEEV